VVGSWSTPWAGPVEMLPMVGCQVRLGMQCQGRYVLGGKVDPVKAIGKVQFYDVDRAKGWIAGDNLLKDA